MSKHQISADILNTGLFQLKPTPPTLVIGQSSSLQISLDTPLTCSINSQSISGNIVIHILKQIQNRDFHVQFIGNCIRYSKNPYNFAEESDRSIIRHQSVSQFVSDILNHTSKRQIDTETNEEIFLEGSQVLRYVEDAQGQEEEIDIQILKPGKYFIPFSFAIPSGSPPSVGMIGFVNIFFTIQYKIIIDQFLTQPIVLEREQKINEVDQFLCTSLEFSLRKFCFVCLGDYCLEGIIKIVYNSVYVKLQFYRKGQKNQNRPLIEQIKVSLIAEIVNVGKQVIAEQRVTLQQSDYGIKKLEFTLCDLNKLKMKSYDNAIFQLRYYLNLEPQTVNGVYLKKIRTQKHYIEI